MTGLQRGGAPRGFAASYRSDCVECPEEIQVDELITGTGGGGYRHVRCPWDDEGDKPTKFQGASLEDMGF